MENIKELLEETEAFLEGHFLLSSGKHSDGYVQCAKLLMYPDKAEIALKPAVEKVKDLDIDVVVGPAMGGIIVSFEIARQLNKPSMFTERVDDTMTLRRGFSIKEGANVLITEYVITTGKSSLEAISALDGLDVNIVGIACLVNRSGRKEINGHPIYESIELDIKNYDKESCPMCKEKQELIKPGSRKKF